MTFFPINQPVKVCQIRFVNTVAEKCSQYVEKEIFLFYVEFDWLSLKNTFVLSGSSETTMRKLHAQRGRSLVSLDDNFPDLIEIIQSLQFVEEEVF